MARREPVPLTLLDTIEPSEEIRAVTTTGTFSNDPAAWSPPGGPAFQMWMCPRCMGEAVPNGNHLACETCGSCYDTETGAYLNAAARNALGI